jgi:uncharacterized protein YkwD
MRYRLSAAFLAVAIFFGALAVHHQAQAADDADLLQAVVAQINAVRAAQGLGPVAADSRLTAAAMSHNADLGVLGRLSHDGFPARMQALGSDYGFVAENLAAGMPNAASVVQAWMQSAPHRANLLQPAVTAVGVARSDGAKVIWTLILAQRA